MTQAIRRWAPAWGLRVRAAGELRVPAWGLRAPAGEPRVPAPVRRCGGGRYSGCRGLDGDGSSCEGGSCSVSSVVGLITDGSSRNFTYRRAGGRVRNRQ